MSFQHRRRAHRRNRGDCVGDGIGLRRATRVAPSASSTAFRSAPLPARPGPSARDAMLDEAVRMAVHSAALALAQRLTADGQGRTLIATDRLSLVSRARYTSPIPPAPSGVRNLVGSEAGAGAQRQVGDCSPKGEDGKAGKREDGETENGKTVSRRSEVRARRSTAGRRRCPSGRRARRAGRPRRGSRRRAFPCALLSAA